MSIRRWLTVPLAAFLLWSLPTQARIPVDQQLVRQTVERILQAWNTPELERWLAPDFPDRNRLLAALDFDAPPTARLRILSIGAIQLLEQERTPDGLVSLVSVSVRAQAEWEEPDKGLQRRTGTSAYLLRITQTVPR